MANYDGKRTRVRGRVGTALMRRQYALVERFIWAWEHMIYKGAVYYCGILLHLRQGVLLDHSGREGVSSRIIFE